MTFAGTAKRSELARLNGTGARGAAETAGSPLQQVGESENFRVLSSGAEPVDPGVLKQCEQLRAQLYRTWTNAEPQHAWRPRCEIVLHGSDAAYARAVGPAAARTVASSLTRQIPGRDIVRHIDIRATRANWLTSALPHELTHVFLADCFAGQKLPRWIDEGAAVLADPVRKQQLHLADARRALAAGNAFRAVELLSLKDYPTSDRWTVFYGESMSLVKFLVDRRSPADFLEFVQIALSRGDVAALEEIYQIASVAELERSWLAELSGQTKSIVTLPRNNP